MKIGTIFDIKEFAVHDGPGVRQTVFFKGCPLRCQWCHNPEGLQTAPQLMFSRSSCIKCGKCVKVCPASEDKCIACGSCVSACPMGLRQIVGTSMTSAQLVETIRENSSYYETLGGGVTFSGGEPLMQGAFLLEVLEQLSDLHTAIETSAYTDPVLFQNVAARLSFLMVDIKLMDPKLHKLYTGVDNALILQNLHMLCNGDKPFVVRIPLIPGVNDNTENLEETARFLSGAKSLKHLEILPYHQTAGAKYSMLGMEYHPDFDVNGGFTFSEHIFKKYKIRSKIL